MTTLSAKTIRRESVKGLTVSILFHLILLSIFYFTRVQESPNLPGFVQVSIGSSAGGSGITYLPPGSALPGGAMAKGPAPSIMKRSGMVRVDISRSAFPVEGEVVGVPRATKLDVSEEFGGKSGTPGGENRLIGEKETGAGMSLEGEGPATEGKLGAGGEGAGFPGSGVGAGIGGGAGYSLQWAGGGTRRKISGDLPSYPEGANVEGQVRLQAIVAADGFVKSVHPIQKANEKLEDAAVKRVRFWKFEPLAVSQPRVDQTCTITFNFKLQ
jgi:TonB family protein